MRAPGALRGRVRRGRSPRRPPGRAPPSGGGRDPAPPQDVVRAPRRGCAHPAGAVPGTRWWRVEARAIARAGIGSGPSPPSGGGSRRLSGPCPPVPRSGRGRPRGARRKVLRSAQRLSVPLRLARGAAVPAGAGGRAGWVSCGKLGRAAARAANVPPAAECRRRGSFGDGPSSGRAHRAPERVRDVLLPFQGARRGRRGDAFGQRGARRGKALGRGRRRRGGRGSGWQGARGQARRRQGRCHHRARGRGLRRKCVRPGAVPPGLPRTWRRGPVRHQRRPHPARARSGGARRRAGGPYRDLPAAAAGEARTEHRAPKGEAEPRPTATREGRAHDCKAQHVQTLTCAGVDEARSIRDTSAGGARARTGLSGGPAGDGQLPVREARFRCSVRR